MAHSSQVAKNRFAGQFIKNMEEIKVIQVGLGPLGVKVSQFIAERSGISIVAAVDKNPGLVGKRLSDLHDALSSDIKIAQNIKDALSEVKADVAVLTTVSDMERITPQIEELVSFGIPVVSTCEELSFPKTCAPELTQRIDEAAKAHHVAVVGTGVNPGFLMDSLPTFLTSVCQNVESIRVNRYQNAAYRRIPFQNKIGAGCTLEQFAEKKAAGTLRHVGLTESMQFIANNLGWKLSKTEDIIEPVIAEKNIDENGAQVAKGLATGVCQIGRGYVDGEEKITLVFQAAVGEAESYDEVIIKGTPKIRSKIAGGVNGDVATCAITVNATRQLLKAQPGLRTMEDIPLVSYFS